MLEVTQKGGSDCMARISISDYESGAGSASAPLHLRMATNQQAPFQAL